MKSFAILLATASYATAAAVNLAPRAANAPNVKAVTGSAPHSANQAPVINPSYVNTEDAAEDITEYCITIDPQSNDWYYTLQGPWGTGSDSFGSLNGQLCLPANNSAGGAMFIGPDPNPGPGSTKFECFIPTSGTANCDISLVDGYSLSMDCNVSGQTIGGSVDLWTAGSTCPDTSDESAGICKNDNGYAAAQSDVNAFFQPAINNGNNYCIWVNCGQDYYFATTDPMTCTITGTAES